MKKNIKEKLQQQIAGQGFGIHKMTAKERVVALIESLHPRKTENDLIRMGPEGDGGYLVPNDLKEIEACFSPGVDDISVFEHDCFKQGMKIFMADRSVDKPNIAISNADYDFQKKFIGCTNNEEFMTMDSWVASSKVAETSDLMLQMDIEGAEYNTLINMSDTLLKRFRIMVFEFHFLHHFWQPLFFDFVETAFRKILQTHVCVHIHPNNYNGIDSRLGVEIPKLAEFTFVRKDRVFTEKYATQFPHELDFDNSEKEHFALPKNWYRSN